MSRIGRKPIKIPLGVEALMDGRGLTIKGPKGTLSFQEFPGIKVEIKDSAIFIKPTKELSKNLRALWGTCRQLIFNMTEGVSKGFEKRLEIEGVGYKAQVKDDALMLDVGFSHPIKIDPLEGISFKVEKNIIIVAGPDKHLVGLTASRIKKAKPAEPYKGKGIKYLGEQIRRKAGKKAAGTE